jgi:hypothetical protein
MALQQRVSEGHTVAPSRLFWSRFPHFIVHRSFLTISGLTQLSFFGIE